MTYKIGRGKPPLETRFKKGQSGNPNGRPKGKIIPLLGFMNHLETETIRVIGNGKASRKIGYQAAIEQMVRKLARGSSDSFSELAVSLKRHQHAAAKRTYVISGGLPKRRVRD
jgi:Family of unknown function (DUF5681)